ncbi:MAG: AP2 domain-containing protein [Bdellovibrionales bacterium]
MLKKWCYFSVGRYQVKIDQEDLKRVAEYTWRIRRRKDSSKLSIITSVRTDRGVKNVSLPQFLMRPAKGKLVYPRRHLEGFDYRKNNLIVCSIQQRQQMLPKKRKDTSSKYRGVSYLKKKDKWRAAITVDRRSINLGDFDSEKEAALAYNRASKKYFGEFHFENTITQSKNRRL